MLRGPRVLLRPMKPEDIEIQHAFDQDVELYGLDTTFPRVSTMESTQAFYESRTKDSDDAAYFAIEADGRYIGCCSLLDLQNRYGNLELAILIGNRDYWGRGYGRDVAHLLLDYGFRYLGARRIALTTHANNERALRCYRACGFVEEGRPRQVVWIEGRYVDLVNMSMLRDEWQRLRDTPSATR